MRSKVAVVLSLIFILAMGTAALVVNTRVLETSPQNEIGRANEVLTPTPPAPAATISAPPSATTGAPPAATTSAPPTVVPAPPTAVVPPAPRPPVSHGDDEDRYPAEGHDQGSDREHDDDSDD